MRLIKKFIAGFVIISLLLANVDLTINTPFVTNTAEAHSGRTDSNGGHYDRKTGRYHYHNGGTSSPSDNNISSIYPTPTPIPPYNVIPTISPTPTPYQFYNDINNIYPTSTPSLTNEYSSSYNAFENNIITLKRYSFDSDKLISLQVSEYITGEEANRVIASESMFNVVPKDNEQWILIKINIQFIYSNIPNEILNAYDVLFNTNGYLDSFYNREQTKTVTKSSVTIFTNNLKGHGQFDVSLLPGESDFVWYALLVDKSVDYVTFKIPTSSNTFSWFTTYLHNEAAVTPTPTPTVTSTPTPTVTPTPTPTPVITVTPKVSSQFSNMYVHYIDVGESDCVLIESENKFMLIDAGDTDDEDTIIDYLNSQKVKKLEYIICTHPHADHVGSMDDVINEFNVGKVIMPAVTHTTKVFEDLLDAIEDKKLKITKPAVGKVYKIGKAEFTIIAPNNKYSDLNNNSVGIKLTNGKNSFVFIGDCETEAIEDILDNKIDIYADVYMAGHHGSDTSTTFKLLDAISPDSAIISVGKNSYGHPNDSVIEMLKDEGITTYRTDESGTIVATSTGTKITFDAKATKLENTKKGANSQASKTIVYITEKGTKYHKEGCSYIKKSKVKTTLKDAKDKGLEPCSRCNPSK